MATKCPICRSKKHDIVKRGVWDAPERNVLQCQKCGTVWLCPMMTKPEAEGFYSDVGYKARLRRISGKNKRAFLANKLRAAARRQVNLLKIYFKKSDVWCDIGASTGVFLAAVKPYVKQAVAIEPGQPEQAELAKRGITYYSFLERVPPVVKFNVVTMFHLFEHIDEPLAYLQELKKHLARGALVFVELPNVDDALVSRYQCEAFKKFYFQSMHCFYYNEKTLSYIFARAGFKKVKCLYLQRYPFSNHLQWLFNGQPGGNEEYEKNFKGINKTYEKILVKAKATDTIMCIFRKK